MYFEINFLNYYNKKKKLIKNLKIQTNIYSIYINKYYKHINKLYIFLFKSIKKKRKMKNQDEAPKNSKK
jgi:hypothetical protein